MHPNDFDLAQWHRSDEILQLRQVDLTPEEVEPFLKAMFARLAVKPTPITLREGASVVRYLKATAWSSEAGKERQALERQTEVVLQMVLRLAPISMASKKRALRFLERCAGTYPFHPEFKGTLQFLRDSPEPNPDVDFFSQPKLTSQDRAVQGPALPRMTNDLSERIYAAYYALTRAKLRGARNFVATALNQRKGGSTPRRKRLWEPEDVVGRVKQFEARLKRDFHTTGPETLQRVRDGLVDQWLWFARSQIRQRAQEIERRRKS